MKIPRQALKQSLTLAAILLILSLVFALGTQFAGKGDDGLTPGEIESLLAALDARSGEPASSLSASQPAPDLQALADLKAKLDKMNLPGAGKQIWICSMDSQVRMEEPGLCPICFMDLIPLAEDGGDESENLVKLSPRARALAEVATVAVERKFVSAAVRMVGKIQYDETRLRYISAWAPGRLDRLFVDYTGTPIRAGAHLVEIYSPELLSSQQELLQAIKAAKQLDNSGIASIRDTSNRTVDSVRKKLRLWGLTPEQIAEIETRGAPTDHMTVYAPIGGIVIEKSAVEGLYVKTGAHLYTIADLSQVWLKLDAYESDLQWIRYGQDVEFETEAYPGETFHGTIMFIAPSLDPKTRTVKVRVNVPNPQAKLKPDMFARATVSPMLSAGGKVVTASLAGKWICPMHPEIMKDGPDKCDLCEMPLASAESLGYDTADPGKADPPLVIPDSAPLITGRRAIVYVSIPGEQGAYEMREVKLGPRAGDYYIVKDGLEEGEMVVVSGNFKIDSEAQIQGKASMMNPPEIDEMEEKPEAPPLEQFDVDETFQNQMANVFKAYTVVQFALSHDQSGDIPTATGDFLASLDGVESSSLPATAGEVWKIAFDAMQQSAKQIAAASDIKKARESFATLSEAMTSAIRQFGIAEGQLVYRIRCPMAFDGRGADWLQDHQAVENPYFSNEMFACGSVVETLSEPMED